VDRISDCEILDENAKPMKLVKGLKNGFRMPKYLAEHLYMLGGDSVRARFQVREQMMNDVIDWFGLDIEVCRPNAGSDVLIITAVVNQRAMFHWALQYLDEVEVLGPAVLRDEIKAALNDAAGKYQ
jgi:predicted DNA-binding transcriptional regulator YafY